MIIYFGFNSSWRSVTTAWHWFLSLIQSIIAASWSKTTTTAKCSVQCAPFSRWFIFNEYLFHSCSATARSSKVKYQMVFRWNGLRYVCMRISDESHFHTKWNEQKNQVKRTTETHLRWQRKHIVIIIQSVIQSVRFEFECTLHTHGEQEKQQSRKTLIKTSKWIRRMIIQSDAFGASQAHIGESCSRFFSIVCI